MIDTKTQILKALESVEYGEAIGAVKLFYQRRLVAKRSRHDEYMFAFGFTKEGTNVYDSILDKYGQRWFVDRSRVVHVEQTASQQEPVTKVVTSTEVNGLTSCPKCGDTLQRFSVCPSCKAAAAGFRFKYLCTCGVEFVTEREL